ncbi:hypothetical protein BGZ65_001112, partial [Modicella reniformis]
IKPKKNNDAPSNIQSSSATGTDPIPGYPSTKDAPSFTSSNDGATVDTTASTYASSDRSDNSLNKNQANVPAAMPMKVPKSAPGFEVVSVETVITEEYCGDDNKNAQGSMGSTRPDVINSPQFQGNERQGRHL